MTDTQSNPRSTLSPRPVQLPIDDWPDGLEETAFIVKLPIREISRRAGLRFEEGSDSLDDFQAALLRIPKLGCKTEPRHFVLQAYRNMPGGGINVIPDVPSTLMIEFIVDMLELRPYEIEWATPRTSHRLRELWRQRRSKFNTRGKQPTRRRRIIKQISAEIRHRHKV